MTEFFLYAIGALGFFVGGFGFGFGVARKQAPYTFRGKG
jgi:hypothetical protein